MILMGRVTLVGQVRHGISTNAPADEDEKEQRAIHSAKYAVAKHSRETRLKVKRKKRERKENSVKSALLPLSRDCDDRERSRKSSREYLRASPRWIVGRNHSILHDLTTLTETRAHYLTPGPLSWRASERPKKSPSEIATDLETTERDRGRARIFRLRGYARRVRTERRETASEEMHRSGEPLSDLSVIFSPVAASVAIRLCSIRLVSGGRTRTSRRARSH